MRHIITLGICGLLALGLAGCTNTSVSPSSAPTPTVTVSVTPSAAPTGAASAAAPTRTVVPTPRATPSITQDNVTETSFTYRSGNAAPRLSFKVPTGGYRVSYTCDTVPNVPNEGLYRVLNARGTVLAERHLQCDGQLHFKDVPATEVARAGTANTILTVTIPEDLQGFDRVHLTVLKFLA